jgi:glycosyltransferase involved in cell wall biosynthesis
MKSCVNIANGIDIKKHIKLSKKKNGKKILFIGRLEKQKNPLLALEFFSALLKIDKSFSLTMIGEGSLKNKILEQANLLKLSKNIKFIFKKINTEEYFKSHDYFLLSSASEGMPLLTIEAAAAGLNLAATASGAMPSVIRDIGGVLFHDNNPDNMATQFLEAIESGEIKPNLKMIQSYSEERMVDSYEKLFKKLCQD